MKNENKKGGYVTIYDGETTLLDMLLDADNLDPITLETVDGPVQFEQLATIPCQDNLYVVMHALQHLDWIEDDACIIFRYTQDPDTGEENLVPETDDDIQNAVYEQYLSLIEDAGGED